MPAAAASTIPEPPSIPAIKAPPPRRDNRFTRSTAGMVGFLVLGAIVLACLGSLWWTCGTVETAPGQHSVRFDVQDREAFSMPPSWWPRRDEAETARLETISARSGGAPLYLMGTDVLGRDVFVRVLAGGGISLGIGICAAMLAVFVGTVYGSVAGYVGGRTDALMMRIVDVLYGLPYILLVVLLAVASGAAIDEYVSRSRERAAWEREQLVRLTIPDATAKPAAATVPPGLVDLAVEAIARRQSEPATPAAAQEMLLGQESFQSAMDDLGQVFVPPREISSGTRTALDLVILLVAIGGVSWLTMARVVRGQVLSLKSQPFMEAARAMGTPVRGIFLRHLLPNLAGPVIVYATLTVPQAILQESFLSFLGIGVRPPLPSWGNLAADGLVELNQYKSRWWLLLFPCLALGLTLLALNFVGEGLREALDPKRGRRG